MARQFNCEAVFLVFSSGNYLAASLSFVLFILFFFSLFQKQGDQQLNANTNQHPGTDGFTSPLKDAVKTSGETPSRIYLLIF